MNPQVESAEELEAATEKICEVYGQARELSAQGIKVYAIDECTGIQAKERKNADQSMSKGKVRRVEYEYIRHGTLALIANFEIASGRVENSTIKETRTEADFALHIKKTVEATPQAKGWWFIVDQLNTHKSESLVRIVAEHEELRVGGDRRKKG